MYTSLALLSSLTVVSAAVVQEPNITLPPHASTYRQAVSDTFLSCYSAYKKYAWGHDELAPVSLSSHDSRNGWGVTIVDAMSTMHVMGFEDLFQEAVNYTETIDFQSSKTEDTVSVFESTIRYLGGILSAYELDGRRNERLLRKARELADKLAYAWIGVSGIPFGHLNFTTNQPVRTPTNIAEAGTLSLEWTLLSRLSGNETYGRLAESAVKRIGSNLTPLPNLPAQGIEPTTGLPVGDYVTWGGGSDSYFEYLLKFPRLFQGSDGYYLRAWLAAVESSITHLRRTSTVGNHTYLGDFDGTRVRNVASHLECFHGGNWILGGRLIGNSTIFDMGLALTDSCWNTYTSTLSGIGPEGFAFVDNESNLTGEGPTSPADQEFYGRNGFFVLDGQSEYLLRPEVIESNFYAFRATGEEKYLRRAMVAFDSMKRVLSVGNAFAGISDVRRADGGSKVDETASFLFAEVFKYLFLTFDDAEHISLDKYVFNTEGHPFPTGPSDLGAAASLVNMYIDQL